MVTSLFMGKGNVLTMGVGFIQYSVYVMCLHTTTPWNLS